jgi:uncharacterized protein (TIGR03435 family)
VVACLALMLAIPSHLSAQAPAAPAFEVASVKPSNPDAGGLRVLPPVAGRFTASNVSLRDLVAIAYGLFEFQIAGGPGWLTSRRFDIQAKSEAPVATIDAMRPMLETLLADRFQLKVHRETREMPVYALVVAGDDERRAKITPSTTDCPKAADDLAMGRAGPGAVAALLQAGRGLPCAIMPVPPPLLPAPVADSMTVRANGATMEDLARFLTLHTGRAVEDRTALSGRYDWEMTFGVVGGVTVALAARPGITRPLITPPTPPGAPQAGITTPPSVMIALQEQLGLKLESTRGQVEIVVIDSVALPEPD